jgi:anti-sigma-K factor RskA
MSQEHTPENGPEADLIAAEYGLGVLEGDALDQAAQRAADDPAFAAAVQSWSLRLAPLSESLAETAPPAALKQRIETALFGPASQPTRGGLWASLSFWRGAAAAFAASTVLAVSLSLAGPGAPAPDPDQGSAYYAALQADATALSVLIRYDPDTNRLSIDGPLGDPAAEPVQPQLWVIPPGGSPRSLGLIASVEGELVTGFDVDQDIGAVIAGGALLAISLEPPGGSPTGAPTGPVIAAGAVRSL